MGNRITSCPSPIIASPTHGTACCRLRTYACQHRKQRVPPTSRLTIGVRNLGPGGGTGIRIESTGEKNYLNNLATSPLSFTRSITNRYLKSSDGSVSSLGNGGSGRLCRTARSAEASKLGLPDEVSSSRSRTCPDRSTRNRITA
jgi:hypothetical protein